MDRTYGDGCKYDCGYCSNSTQCHHITGICLNGCEAGYKTDLCNQSEWEHSVWKKDTTVTHLLSLLCNYLSHKMTLAMYYFEWYLVSNDDDL